MSKLDLVIERVRKLPPERQEALAAEIELWLEGAETESMFSEEEWAAIEASMDDRGPDIPHEQVADDVRAKFPG